MGKTIDMMIEELEVAREEMGGDAEVRIAYQQQYPIRASVDRITVPESEDPDDLYDEGSHAAGQQNDGRYLWIAAGVDDLNSNENPYGPKWAWGHDNEDEW